MDERKKIVHFPRADTKSEGNNNKRKDIDKSQKAIGRIIGSIGFISAVIGILVFLTGKNFPDYFSSNMKPEIPTDVSGSSGESDTKISNYFISVAVSDTISSSFEPTKKIIVTASDDTANMIITGESSTESYGPFNMTMESSRHFIFLAVFEQPDNYIITITAYSEDGEIATEEITIEV